MDSAFIEEQKKKVFEYLNGPSSEDIDEKRRVAIVFQYLLSLIQPERFTNGESEDIRKLAFEFGYEKDTDFDTWLKTSMIKAEE